ncbi:MAG: phosphatidate cytidylyltransferase, partial [Gemmataceae bacterium]
QLSPKKTWEGFTGGMAVAMITSITVWYLHPQLFRYDVPEAALFGLVVGTFGVLGDLAESLIKREAQQKDAATSIPGFGGLLDVVDSILFAGPVVYLWFDMR